MSNPWWQDLLNNSLPVMAALGGVLAAGWNDRRRDQRAHERTREVRSDDRRHEELASLRKWELENLIHARNTLWALAREAAQVHMADVRSAEAGQGYGGTRIPPGEGGDDVTVARDARHAVEMILDDRLRERASAFITRSADVGLLGVRAHAMGQPLVSKEIGESVWAEVVQEYDDIDDEIASKIRELVTLGANARRS